MRRRTLLGVCVFTGVVLALSVACLTARRRESAGWSFPALRGAVPHGSICLVASEGRPVVGATIVLRPRGSGGGKTRIVKTSESGCAECEVRDEEAPYAVSINIPDSYPLLTSFERLDGWNGDGVAVWLAPAWNMEIEVVDAKGAPAPGSVVVFRWVGDPSDVATLQSTNARGQLSMRRLQPEALELDAISKEEREAFLSAEPPYQPVKLRYRVAWGTQALRMRMER